MPLVPNVPLSGKFEGPAAAGRWRSDHRARRQAEALRGFRRYRATRQRVQGQVIRVLARRHAAAQRALSKAACRPKEKA